MIIEDIAFVMMWIIVALLVLCLYMNYRILKNMRDDLHYSTARIYLSSRSVRGIEVLVAGLIGYAFLIITSVWLTQGILLDVLARIAMMVLFGGWAYFLYQISSVTAKSDVGN